jgi:quercetin dioxygenase-like cupin family protein
VTNDLPADDAGRSLAHSSAEDGEHVSVAGDTYTILVSGADTAGRFALIDMLVPAGGGPPPHRHDFEETVTILEGEIEVTFRGEKAIARTGETVNIPANAPHFFRNVSGGTARMLCICSPAGQEEFFLAVGDRVESRTAPPPQLEDAARAERMARALELAPRFRTELLLP